MSACAAKTNDVEFPAQLLSVTHPLMVGFPHLAEFRGNKINTPMPTSSALLKADPKATLTFSAEKDGKLRVTYAGWEDPRVFQAGSGSSSWPEVVRCWRSGGASPWPDRRPDPYREC